MSIPNAGPDIPYVTTVPTSYLGPSVSVAGVLWVWDGVSGGYRRAGNDPDERTAWYPQSTESEPAQKVIQYANTLKGRALLAARQRLMSEAGDKINHDATVVLDASNNKYYIVCTANRVDTGDSPSYSNTFVRLRVGTLPTTSIPGAPTSYTVAQNAGTYDGITLQSGAGQANALLIGTKLHVLFCSKVSGVYALVHCEFDTVGLSLSNYKVCSVSRGTETWVFNSANLATLADDETIDIVNASLASVSLNATIGYDSVSGYYYACACLNKYAKNGIIIRSLDLISWEIVGVPKLPVPSNAIYEGAVYYKDTSLFLALRQTPELDSNGDSAGVIGRNTLIVARLNPTDLSVYDCVELPDSGSRPAFFTKTDGSLWLAHCTYERSGADLVEIDTNILKNSVVKQQLLSYGNYATFATGGSVLGPTAALFVATNGTQGLIASTFPLNYYSSRAAVDDIYADVLQISGRVVSVGVSSAISGVLAGDLLVTSPGTTQTLPKVVDVFAGWKRRILLRGNGVTIASNEGTAIIFYGSNTAASSVVIPNTVASVFVECDGINWCIS